MIRVGFVISVSKDWMGGVNYLKNLLEAVASLPDRKIHPVLFFGKNISEAIIALFRSYGEVVQTPLLDQNNVSGIMNATLLRIFNRSFLMEKILRDNKVEVISHSRLAFGGRSIKKINWIVDFQHIHLPRMFSWFEIVYRNMLFRRFAQGSDVVVLSSDDAGNDFRKIYPRYAGKAKILKFVSQPDVRIYSMDDIGAIEKKYGFRGKFFYLPNQLWKHKNHRVVLRALDILKRRGEDVLVISSGLMTDYRHKGYKEELMDYIRRKNLEKNILFLGLIDYIDVLALMRHSIAVINPSLFEGWSSTVEEAKSIGKSLILSRIAVHEEQCPPSVEYFDPENERELAEIISEKLKKSSGGPELELEKEAGRRIKERTRQFGATYQKIVLGIRS